MLARWALPVLRCRARCTLIQRTSYTTKSFKTDEAGVTKVELYGDDGQFRFDMDFYNHHGRDNDSPIVLYLPGISHEVAEFRRGDSSKANYIPNGIQNDLEKAFRVVRINYRWSRVHPFPRPFHDVIFAYDAIVKNLCSTKTKVGVYGHFVGGTLATSLALTESDPRKPGHVSILAITDSPLDFATFATDLLTPENYPYIHRIENDKERHRAAQNLLRIQRLMQTSLFSNPSACFDPFASPILFFRNSGREVVEDFVAIDALDQDYALQTDGGRQSFNHTSAHAKLPSKGVRTPPIRFPPKGSGLIIPKTLIHASTQGGWESHQGQELAKLMRRSVLQYEMKENVDRDTGAEEEAASRVTHVLDLDPVGMTTGFRELEETKKNKIIDWLEDAMHN